MTNPPVSNVVLADTEAALSRIVAIDARILALRGIRSDDYNVLCKLAESSIPAVATAARTVLARCAPVHGASVAHQMTTVG